MKEKYKIELRDNKGCLMISLTEKQRDVFYEDKGRWLCDGECNKCLFTAETCRDEIPTENVISITKVKEEIPPTPTSGSPVREETKKLKLEIGDIILAPMMATVKGFINGSDIIEINPYGDKFIHTSEIKFLQRPEKSKRKDFSFNFNEKHHGKVKEFVDNLEK